MLRAILDGLDPSGSPETSRILAHIRTLVRWRTPHERQVEFLDSPAKRKVIRAGRRGGKTVGSAILAVRAFLNGRRILYAAPTQNQLDAFWDEVNWSLEYAVEAGLVYKNQTMHLLQVPGTSIRIRGKTAWDADTLRGDYADLLILDEYQLMNEEAWGRVGVPMLLDNDGDAIFIYTPPSLHSRSRTKARDPRHAAKLFQRAKEDTTGRWQVFHFTSHENPYLPPEALDEIATDMTMLAYQQEIMAEDTDQAPGALWTRDMLDATRVANDDPELAYLQRIVVGIDPPGGATECGIIIGGIGRNRHLYVLGDYSLAGGPSEWGQAVVDAYNAFEADVAVGESNFGGDMVEHVILTVPGGAQLRYKVAHATRGKAVRAEPIAAKWECGKAHLVGHFPELEDELCNWEPGMGMSSPNRLDAMVWALTECLSPPTGRVTRPPVSGLYRTMDQRAERPKAAPRNGAPPRSRRRRSR